MASLTGSSIATTYDRLLALPSGGLNGSTLVAITDGDGGATACISITDNDTGKAVLAIDGSHANGTELQIDNSATDGDSFLSFQLSGTSKFTMGVDDGDSDIFKIGTTAIGTGTMFALDTNSRISLSNNDLGTSNTLLGKLAGDDVDSGGNYNVFIGENAGHENSVGDNNVAIGFDAFKDGLTLANTDNTFIGHSSGSGTWLTAASINNVAVGSGTMVGAMNGCSYNTVIGKGAGASLTQGDNNVLIGHSAGDALTSTSENICIGSNAGGNLTSIETTLVGISAGAAITSATGNTALGYNAMKVNTIGSRNMAIGYQTMDDTDATFTDATCDYDDDPTVDCNANGSIAVGQSVTGTGIPANSYITAITDGGSGTTSFELNAATTGGAVTDGTLTFSGSLASDDNIFIGYQSGSGTWTYNESSANVAIGNYTLNAALNGSIGTVAIGHSALTALTSGAGNTAIGYTALAALTSGAKNVAIGYQALMGHTTGSSNIAIGYGAMDGTAGDVNDAPASVDNVFIGLDAGGGNWVDNAPSNYNVGVGNGTMDGALDGASGNVAVGFDGLGGITGGDANTAFGNSAGDAITTGDNNTCLGASTDPGAAGATNQTAIGFECTAVNVDNTVTIGSADVTAVYMSSDSQALVHSAGIQFAATQVANAGANVFDDYEEGTWTPMITDGSNNATMHGNNGGYYTKIGRTVHVTAYITSSSLGSVSGNTSLSGLPFTCANANGAYSGIAIVGNGGLAITAGESLGGYVAKNTTTVALLVTDHVVGATNLQHDEWTDDGEAMFQATYMI